MTKDYAIGLLSGLLEGVATTTVSASYDQRVAMKSKIITTLERINKELKDEPE